MNKNLLNTVKSFFIAALLMSSTFIHAQTSTRDSLLRIYNTETIHSSGKFYVKGSKQLKFQDLKSELTSPLTKTLFKRSRGNLAAANLLTVTAIGALVTGAIIKKNNNGAGIALNIGAIVFNLGSIHFRKKSSEIIDRAIWQRNKEILFGVE